MEIYTCLLPILCVTVSLYNLQYVQDVEYEWWDLSQFLQKVVASRVVMREDSGVQCFAQEAHCGESSPILGNKGGRGSAAPASITPGKSSAVEAKTSF